MTTHRTGFQSPAIVHRRAARPLRRVTLNSTVPTLRTLDCDPLSCAADIIQEIEIPKSDTADYATEFSHSTHLFVLHRGYQFADVF